ncbi:MAG: GntR family transcriptional regulator [Planctomycetes bacterium]|nr:GntR family transcriptional regulator [Planctomycetota bacterium]
MDTRPQPFGLLRGFSDDTSKREQAYYQLRRLLILQQIREGTRLREAEWSERFNVNRSALREALARLEAEGLVEMGPKTGYFVPRLAPEDIAEIQAVRFMLESGAIEIICETGLNSARNLRPMKQACDQLARLVQDEYLLGAVEADWRFHEALVLASQNQRLAIAYRHSPMLIIHPDVLAGKEWEQTMRRTVEEHRALLAAVLEGDAVKAKETLRLHIRDRRRPSMKSAAV